MTENTTEKKLTPLIPCSICGQDIQPHPFSGWAGGNNAWPVNDGRCCDNCDNMIVIPRRIRDIYRRKEA